MGNKEEENKDYMNIQIEWLPKSNELQTWNYTIKINLNQRL